MVIERLFELWILQSRLLDMGLYLQTTGLSNYIAMGCIMSFLFGVGKELTRCNVNIQGGQKREKLVFEVFPLTLTLF